MTLRLLKLIFEKPFFFFIPLLIIIILIPVYSPAQYIDVQPQGFMADATSPYALHFTITSSFFSGMSVVTTKIRVLPGVSSNTANSYTWCTTGVAGWRNEGAPNSQLGLFPIFTVSNNTVQGWLFGKSISKTIYGTASCAIRFYKSTSMYIETTSVLSFYSWNSTSDAGWLSGTTANGANVIVLAMDSINTILGTYCTESNGIVENYPNTNGYFKVAVPVGIVDHLEFRHLNNQYISTQTGPWTIDTNTITTIPALADIPPKIWLTPP